MFAGFKKFSTQYNRLCSSCLYNEFIIQTNQKQFVKGISLSSKKSKEVEYTYNNHSQYGNRNNRHYFSHFSNLISISFGLIVGLSSYKYIKKKYPDCVNRVSNYVSLNSLFPSVTAASFISTLKDDSSKEKLSEKKLTNRKSHNFIADVVEKVSDGVVLIEIKDDRRTDHTGKKLNISNGSGFVVDPSGLILTNAHVVANKPRASSIMIRLANGQEFRGIVEEVDVISDLALVRIPTTTGLIPLVLGSSKDIRPGEFVVALGCPLSLTNSITSGVVSSVGRASKDLGLRGRDIDYIQTDAAITFGNSGGPLVNLDGEVIGINSMKVTSGISFAIPIDHAKAFLEKAAKKRAFLAKHKSQGSEEAVTKRRYLGITMLTLTPEIILQMQQRTPGSPAYQIPANLTHGILVWRIVVGSPAYNAGLEPGDIITRINGVDVGSSRDVYKLLESNDDLTMVIIRKGKAYTVTISPED